MSRSISQQDISWFLDLNEKGQLDLDPPYQRRSVWTRKDKRFFIDTILNNYPAPPVFLHKTLDDRGHATYHVVDGKQRLSTIIDFPKNKIRIPEDFANQSLQKKRWSELPRDAKEIFWNYTIIVEFLPSVSDADIRDTFERINRNSRKLGRQEIRHAKYDGWFINEVEAEAVKGEWKDFGVITAARVKRMLDVQFISELFAVCLKETIIGFDQDWLDQLYADYEEPEEEVLFVEVDFRASVERTKDILKKLLVAEPEIITCIKAQAHFYSLWGVLTLLTKPDLDIKAFAIVYLEFMQKVTTTIRATGSGEEQSSVDEAVGIYAANSRGASTDLAPRQARHKQLMLVMADVAGVVHENL